MSHKIQITVDDHLNEYIRKGAQSMGLSVSSYARLALKQAFEKKRKMPLINQAIDDIENNRLEPFDLQALDHQINKL